MRRNSRLFRLWLQVALLAGLTGVVAVALYAWRRNSDVRTEFEPVFGIEHPGFWIGTGATIAFLLVIIWTGFITPAFRSEADRAVERVREGMPFDDVNAVIGGTCCGGGDIPVEGTGWRIWGFPDHSAASVWFNDNHVIRYTVRPSPWYWRVSDLVRALLGI
jgi:hypothetical protein